MTSKSVVRVQAFLPVGGVTLFEVERALGSLPGVIASGQSHRAAGDRDPRSFGCALVRKNTTRTARCPVCRAPSRSAQDRGNSASIARMRVKLLRA
jgi:hypothetical protein